MKNRSKLTFLQRSRRILWYFTVSVLVIAAISMTLARSLISNVGSFRNQLEVIASQYLEQPLRIETFDAKIIGFTPTFIFKNVSVLKHSSDKVMAKFKEARVGISILNSIKRGELISKSFVINGINLVVSQNKNNTFKVKGINVAEFDPTKNIETEESNELSNWLFDQETLKLENSTIHWHNSITNKVLKFSNINLQFNNSGSRHTLSGDWQLQSKIAKRFKIELDMTGDLLNPASWEGAAYVKGEDVNILEFGIPSNLIPLKPTSGIYNFEVWADFKLGQLVEVTGATNVRNLKFKLSKLNNVIEIDKMGAVWRWDNLADGWALNIDRFHYEVNKKIWPLSRVLIESHHRFQPNAIMDIYIDELDFQDASEFVQKIKVLDSKNIIRLQKIYPRGRISDTHIRFNVDEVFSDDFLFKTRFNGVTINSDGYIPGITNLTGDVSTSNSAGSIVIESKDTVVQFPKMFRNQIDISQFDGRLDWYKESSEWHLRGKDLNLSNADIKLNSNLHLIFPNDKKSPLIDLQISFEEGDVASVGKYLPVSIMDEDLIEWLDTSIISGTVKNGGVILQGRLNDFPYLNNNGKFEVNLESTNFVLRYLDGWPKITNASANLVFTGKGFNIDLTRAKMFNSVIRSASISIDDFSAPELVIKGDIDSSTSDVFKFLVNSPIARDSRSVIEEFTTAGKSKINIQVNVPLSEEMSKTHSTYYKGSVLISDSSLSIHDDILKIRDINGKLEFNKDGFTSTGLKAICFNQPAKIVFYSQSKQQTFSHHILLEGKFDSNSIQRKFNIPGMEKSVGIAKWQGIFNFGYITENAEVPASIVVTSNLQGINLNLPSPLNKTTDYKLPVSIESQFISKDKNKISISIDDGLFISGVITQSKNNFSLTSAIVDFDTRSNEELQDGVILVQGDIHDIDFNSWFDFAKEFNFESENKTKPFISPELDIVFDVSSFKINDPIEDVNATKSAIKKPDNVITETSDLDPRGIPGFSGEIRNIYYANSKVGNLNFNFEHSRNGFEIKKLNLHSDNFDIVSSGIWHIFPNKTKDRYLTKFTNVKFLSSDLGAMLSALGFKSILNKGKSNTDLTVWWYESPFDFSVDKFSAEILLNVSEGEILDIDPKTGRLLGLLSLSNLPRRLFGDFSDVFSSGFIFDSAVGKIRIANGVMSSDDILLKSSPAEVHIFGETDLSKHTFDQKIKVIPNITDTAAVVTGIFGGLPTLIITKLLGGIIDLDSAEMRTYHITGTWEKPIITTITEPELEPETTPDTTFDDDDSND